MSEPAFTGKYLDPYPIDKCPHCGATLNAPDDNLVRHCATCRYSVLPAEVEWTVVD